MFWVEALTPPDGTQFAFAIGADACRRTDPLVCPRGRRDGLVMQSLGLTNDLRKDRGHTVPPYSSVCLSATGLILPMSAKELLPLHVILPWLPWL